MLVLRRVQILRASIVPVYVACYTVLSGCTVTVYCQGVHHSCCVSGHDAAMVFGHNVYICHSLASMLLIQIMTFAIDGEESLSVHSQALSLSHLPCCLAAQLPIYQHSMSDTEAVLGYSVLPTPEHFH